MTARLNTLLEDISSSLWFVPGLLTGLALLLSTILVWADAMLAQRGSPLTPWVFSGTADAARTVLSVIAGSLITVISIAFSLTIVALQQAASQFSPRVLRRFTSSRSNQIVIGAYIATFVYALMVLRAVRSRSEQNGDAFVPALSVTVSIALALVCLALLIFFIHHTSQSLRATVIIDGLRSEVVGQFDSLFVAGKGTPVFEERAPVPPERGHRVYSDRTGFVRRVDEQQLLDIPFGNGQRLWVQAAVGDFLPYGGLMAVLEGDLADADLDTLTSSIRNAFTIDTERSIIQDPMFGIRQLVDIALRALSPGINDPTTAEYVLFHLGDIVGRLADRPFPSCFHRSEEGDVVIIVRQVTWDHIVDTAFSQIRRTAVDDVHVTRTLLQVLQNIAARIPPGDRAAAIKQQLDEIRGGIQAQSFSPGEVALLQATADRLEDALHESLGRLAAVPVAPGHEKFLH